MSVAFKTKSIKGKQLPAQCTLCIDQHLLWHQFSCDSTALVE